eukprot:maker-scaffold661_size154698-snap-gene-0.22 protein:Tk09491 transcript:maker-scaffold661_size154698-snap-gene-0.22-mRNA-1 annotation:"predicted protein"
MVMALVAFFMSNGIEASRITILAPYLGQTKLIRSLLPNTLTQVLGSQPERPSVQTIDMFQGDENDFIIVSLVRSNARGQIGFLDSLNRRCVAQSRAKCGLYFVGNESTLLQTSGIWTKLVNHMKTTDCLGPKITVQCPKHGTLSQKPVETSSEMVDIVKDFRSVCNLQCKDLFPCRKLEHACQKACLPKHRHDCCRAKVDDVFENHALSRKCHQAEKDILCRWPCSKKRASCGHKCFAKCYKDCNAMECQECQKTNIAYKEQAREKVKKLMEKIKKSPHAKFQIKILSISDPEYYQVQDHVTKYVQSMHNWCPTITKVESVINYEREMAFEAFRANGFKDYSALKFHGTTDAGVKDIPKNGFREPDPNPANGKRGMYGQGIYFATDSSKSARDIYTKGSNKLLLCNVLGSQPERPSVQTIDMFQGDENDFIIVSLVRSNARGQIGFLDSLNRRCVAQSRAKCGLYFVGNESTLLQTSGIWTKLVNHMKTTDCLGPKITVQCPKHGTLSQKPVETSSEMVDIVKDFRSVCNLQCKDLFPCRKLEHACQKACLPKHRHDCCRAKVDDVFE